jgi:hypothetical protein
LSDLDVFGDYEPGQPATLEEDRQPAPEKPGRPRKPRPGRFYNFVSFLFLLATVGFVAFSLLLIQNPNAPYNPFPPGTPTSTPTLFLLGDAEQGGAVLPPTWTPSPTATGGPSATPRATATKTPTPHATATGVTQPPGGTNTIAVFPFTLQDEAVTYTENFNEEGCAWLSIAGQVFDLDNNPLSGLPVQVTGENVEQIVFTGTATQFGPSGYEVFLNSTPVEDEFVVRLLNTTGMPLSEPIVVRTLSACDRNVAIVNFVQNHEFTR